jgi:hypothetical protein
MIDFFTIWIPFIWFLLFIAGYISVHGKPINSKLVYTAKGLSVGIIYLLILIIADTWINNKTEISISDFSQYACGGLAGAIFASIIYYIRYIMLKEMGIEEMGWGASSEKFSEVFKQKRKTK